MLEELFCSIKRWRRSRPIRQAVASVLWKLALRDTLVLLLSAVLWVAGQSWEAGGAGVVASLAAGLAGCLLGLAWGFAAHEWGHLLGARLARGNVQVSSSLDSIQLFQFRTDDNSRGQFLSMAFGGLVLLWIQAGLFATVLSTDSVAGISAIGFAVLGALFTTGVEAPIAARVALGGPLPPAA